MLIALVLIVLAAGWRVTAVHIPELVNFAPLMALTFCAAVYIRDRRFWVVIHCDRPADVIEHEHVVVDDVADVHERLLARADFITRMPIRMPRGGDDFDSVVEELLTVFGDDELVLQDVEVLADRLHHRG